MGDRLAATIRFHSEGQEAELFRKLQEGKRAAGLSLPEYVKKILAGYFEDSKRQEDVETVLREIREEYRNMAARIERTIQSSMREHDAVLLGALGRLGVSGTVSGDAGGGKVEYAKLPEESGEIPEGTLDFLNGL